MRPVSPESPPDCSEVVRALWEYLDGRLRPESVAAIEVHLDRCEGCRAYAHFETRLVDTLAGLRRRHSDPARLKDHVLKVLRAAGMG
jgi:anti-sigma factor (TIGR02949 family)